MRGLKFFVIAVVLLLSTLSIIYLMYKAKGIERYTISKDYIGKTYVLYSSKKIELKDGIEKEDILKFSREALKSLGYSVYTIEFKNRDDFYKKVLKITDKNNQCTFIDICSSELFINKNTVLLRVFINDGDYSEGMQYLKGIKNKIGTDNLKINIIADSKSAVINNFTYNNIGIEFSNKNNFEEVKKILLEVFTGL